MALYSPSEHLQGWRIDPLADGLRRAGVIWLALAWVSCRSPMAPPNDDPSGDDAARDTTAVEVSPVEPDRRRPLPSPLRRPYQDLRRHSFRAIGEDTGIDVSPDGEAVLFSSTRNTEQPKVYLKEEGNALVRSITTGRFRDVHPKFSPSGEEIAFASDREGNFDIWIISLKSPGVAEQLTSSVDDEVHPTFSPDGKQVAFCRRGKQQGWTLWIQHRQKQDVTELGPGLFPEWSPTGEWIAFQRPSERREGWYGIWIVRPDGSEVRQVVAFDDYGAIQPTWSPTAGQIAFTTVVDASAMARWDGLGSIGKDIAIIDLRTGRLFQLTHHEGSNWSPAWGLNGRIYFTSDRYGGRNLLSLSPPEVDNL